jgi:hypothetical protein
VLEHVYDVEYVLAEITCKLRPGGLFFVWGDFDNVTCNGDHLERNRFYARSGVWHLLREALGYTLVSHRPHGTPVQVWKLENKREVGLEELLITVYETTRRHARGRIVKDYLKAFLPRRRGWTMQNLADAIHTYGFTSERLRKLSPQGARPQPQGNGRPGDR